MAKKTSTKLKAGALSTVEKFYIDNNPDNKTPEELATTLNRSIKLVRSRLHDKSQDKSKKVDGPTSMSKLMGRHKRNDAPIAAIMTPAASELGDEVKKQRTIKNTHSFIHKPKG